MKLKIKNILDEFFTIHQQIGLDPEINCEDFFGCFSSIADKDLNNVILPAKKELIIAIQNNPKFKLMVKNFINETAENILSKLNEEQDRLIDELKEEEEICDGCAYYVEECACDEEEEEEEEEENICKHCGRYCSPDHCECTDDCLNGF